MVCLRPCVIFARPWQEPGACSMGFGPASRAPRPRGQTKAPRVDAVEPVGAAPGPDLAALVAPPPASETQTDAEKPQRREEEVAERRDPLTTKHRVTLWGLLVTRFAWRGSVARNIAQRSYNYSFGFWNTWPGEAQDSKLKQLGKPTSAQRLGGRPSPHKGVCSLPSLQLGGPMLGRGSVAAPSMTCWVPLLQTKSTEPNLRIDPAGPNLWLRRLANRCSGSKV